MESKPENKKSKQFSVAVVATMSSGKSTLLNAMIGKEILPSRNEACTATVFRIEDDDSMKKFRGRFCNKDLAYSSWIEPLGVSTLCEWNSSVPFQIEIRGNLPRLSNSINHNRIAFIDTPGPNNSMNEDHANIARRIVSGVDYSAMIFVINAEQSGVNDEWRLLQQMHSVISGMDCLPKVVFSINKIDLFDLEKGESIAGLVERNRQDLGKLGFVDPVVIPTCSEMSLLLREAFSGKKKLREKNIPADLKKMEARFYKAGRILCYVPRMSSAKQSRLHHLIERFSAGYQEYRASFLGDPELSAAFRAAEEKILKSQKRRKKRNYFRRYFLLDGHLHSMNEMKRIELLTGVPLIETIIQEAFDSFAEKEEDGGIVPVESETVVQAEIDQTKTPEKASDSSSKTEDAIPRPVPRPAPQDMNREIEVEITHNPYFVTTTIAVDHQELPPTHSLSTMVQGRLSNWIDRFISGLYDVYHAGKVKVSFTGTRLDAADVKSAIEEYLKANPGFRFDLQLKTSSEDSDIRIRKLRDVYEMGKTGPFKELFESPEMEEAFERALDPTFEVNVIATMSSGKSTLVNALLGIDLMPSKNEACTAAVARIFDDDRKAFFEGQVFDDKGKPMSGLVPVSRDILEQWNDDENSSLIDLYGNIPTVSQTESCSLVVVDTPGPNNSRNIKHQNMTLSAIQSKPLSMIIYVLNSTQLSTNDDCWLLSQVRQAMSEGGRQAQDRFIFIANKIDVFDQEKRESVATALENVRCYLKKNGINNPLIIPVSAQFAKLIRLKRENAPLSRKERFDLQAFIDKFINVPDMNMLEHCRNSISRECMNLLDKRLEHAVETGDIEEQAELLSGIPVLETLLNEFLQKHAVPAKLKDAVDSLNAVIYRSKIAQKINEQLSHSDKELKEICRKLEAFQNEKKNLDEAKEFRNKVKGMQYSISGETAAFCDSLYVKSERLISQLQLEAADDKWLPGAAEKQLDAALTRCHQFESELIVGLTKRLDKEYGQVIQGLRTAYQKRTEQILKERFPENISLRELHAVTMTLPPVSEMMNYHSRSEKVKTGKIKVKVGNKRVKVGTEQVYVETERVKVGTERYCSGSHEESTSVWYKPWTWGSTRTVKEYSYKDKYETRKKYETRDRYEIQDVYEERDTYEERTYIDMVAATRDLVQELRRFSIDNINNFKTEAAKNVEKAKTTLLDLMDVIDERLLQVQTEFQEASQSKTRREALIAENQKKIDWFNWFEKELRNVLSI